MERRRILTSAAERCLGSRYRTVAPGNVAAVRAGNTRTDSAHNRYHIAPVELVKIQREARRQGLEIAGFYHCIP